MNVPKIDKFVWQELFTDSKGRTSPGKVVGFYACITSVTVFGVAAIKALYTQTSIDNIDILLTTITMQSVALFTAGATLLGIRRFTKDKEIPEQPPIENQSNEQ